ncbi:50S ribosomal protein L25 [Candidatus Wolfebacteria bacterium]|nr:50S ribosomal protein L25 [Candidatus Wolfebacteria bacterium]
MEITAQKREIFGKNVKSLKKLGLIPAEFYGHGMENLHLSVSAKDFLKIWKQAGESALIKLEVNGKKFNVLIHDIDKNYLTDEISHIDFYNVKMDEKIRIKIPVFFEGIAPAVKEKGGVLVKSMHELEVEALPADLPHRIEVNLSLLLEIGSSILVKDLQVDEKVKILIDSHTVVASIIETAKEEEIPAATMTVEDIKVETEEKKEARAEAKTETKTKENKPTA